MKRPVYKILTLFVFPVIIIALVYAIIVGIKKPVDFENEKAAREKVAIQRLKDIRTLQDAFKAATSDAASEYKAWSSQKSKKGEFVSEVGKTVHYASTIDSLIEFYKHGSITVELMIGSMDDSVAVANTKALKKEYPKITNAEMLALAQKGERIIVTAKMKFAVRDTLFKSRPNFCIDSIFMIPFSGKRVEMSTVIRQVSGVDVPLFQACMPYDDLLTGMNHQLLVNLKSEREKTDRYPGLMVGSIDTPNNNAGNWE